MLTPDEIQALVELIQPRVDELNTLIASDLIRRVMARLGRGELYMTGTDNWALQVFQSAGGHLDAVQQILTRWTGSTHDEIRRIFEAAGIMALQYDSSFYLARGMEALDIRSEGMLRLLEDSYTRTCGSVDNFTRTTAQASQQRLISALDTAHLRVMSGAVSYTQAVDDAVGDLVNTQLRVQYPTGHSDTIETAVLRAVRTGVAQAAGSMAIQGMVEREWDVILVSSHLGARYGDGGENPSNHAWWQGKHYSRTGATPELPPFEETTGYGTGEGLCGWNCRHSFGPGDVEHNPFEQFDSEKNKAVYDLSQQQRRMEARIRRTKGKLVTLREAVDASEDDGAKATLTQQYERTARLLSRQNEAYNAFCEEHKLKRYSERLQTAAWTREDAKRSILAANK